MCLRIVSKPKQKLHMVWSKNGTYSWFYCSPSIFHHIYIINQEHKSKPVPTKQQCFFKMGRDHKTMALNYYKSVTLSICLSSKLKLVNNVRKHVNFECAMIGLVIDSECPCLGVYQMPNSIALAVILVLWKSIAPILWAILCCHKSFMMKKKDFIYRSSRPELFCRKGVLRNFAKFTGENLAHVFSCEFYKTSKNTSFYRAPSVADSVYYLLKWHLYSQ